MQPGLDQNYIVERKALVAANGNNLITRNEYRVEAALDLADFAPFLAEWNRIQHPSHLPEVSDFDAVRSVSDNAAVHIVDASSADAAAFRWLRFDGGSRMDGRDLSGIQVGDYPGRAVRQSMLVDYEQAARIGRCSLMDVFVDSDDPPRRFARLILPVSEAGGTSADRLLVVVRLLECDGWPCAESPGLTATNISARDGLATWQFLEDLRGESSIPDLHPARDSSSPEHSALQIMGTHLHAGRQETLDDRHLLELLLQQSMPEGEARDLAGQLIEEFGSLSMLTAMSNERLARFSSVPPVSIVSMKIVRELAARMIKQQLFDRDLLSDTRKVIEYCHARMAYETVEHVRLLFLDQKNHLIKDEAIHGGGVSTVPVDPRQIVKRAIILDAQSIILAHNHPSGDPSPSAADVDLTLDLKRCAHTLGLRLLDHLIIGRSGHVSLRGMGYLDSDPQ